MCILREKSSYLRANLVRVVVERLAALILVHEALDDRVMAGSAIYEATTAVTECLPTSSRIVLQEQHSDMKIGFLPVRSVSKEVSTTLGTCHSTDEPVRQGRRA